MLCCVTVAAGVVPVLEGAEAPPGDVLAAALEANREMARLAAELREENARLREENSRLRVENAGQAAELENLRADLAVLQRMLFGRSSERSRPGPAAGDDGAGRGGERQDGPGGSGRKRGRGRGRGGGITRICPASRWSGTLPAAGTAARSAGCRSRGWAITSRSCWTGW